MPWLISHKSRPALARFRAFCKLNLNKPQSFEHKLTGGPTAKTQANMSSTGGTSSTGDSSTSTSQAPSRRGSYHPRQIWQGVKTGRPPISVILISTVLVLTIGVAFLAWGLTYNAANYSATILASSLQQNILTRILDDISFTLKTAEQATHTNVLNWANGFYSMDTVPGRTQLLQAMQNSLVPRADMFSSQYFTTMPAGEMNGAVTYIDPGTGLRNWDQWRMTGADFQVWHVNMDGTQKDLLPYVEFSTNMSTGVWVTAVDLSNQTSAAWTPYYIVQDGGHTGWKSYSEVAVDQNGGTVGVQSTDVTTEFLLRLLLDATGAIPYQNALYAFEVAASGDTIITSSLDQTGHDYITTETVDGSATDFSMTMQQAGVNNSNIRAIYSYLNQNAGGSLQTFLNAHPPGFTVELQLDSGTHEMQIGQVQRGANMNWAIAILINRNDVMSALHRSNLQAIGIIAGVVAASCILVMLFSWWLAQSLHQITRDLQLLSNFKFQDVMQRDADKETGARRPKFSRIAELWEIQKAFHRMVVNFAQAVSQNRRFGEATTGRASMLPSGGPSVMRTAKE
ncbi:hypothetical protein HDU87_008644 [Geranomyces variabilis]|uniref:Uncharacterized protein n=1 Tax=Geranomyces variabilis TaxID=109894 RepID=A0AAD5TCR5_9FUNG|nr:hypothetical protein HDU87_008644 [Geranomyces variabilis]